jgi:hypothetical protein
MQANVSTKAAKGRVLMAEICRYLVAVEAFRAEGCEPRWLPEQPPPSRLGRG